MASGLEPGVNSGGAKIINLVKARMKNAIRTFKNNFSADLYSDGTLPNQIGGLQVLVSDAGTGTVGGIDSSAWAFWEVAGAVGGGPLLRRRRHYPRIGHDGIVDAAPVAQPGSWW